MLSAGGGSSDRAFGTVRYGARLGEQGWYRLYAEGFERRRDQHSEGPINDGWYVAVVFTPLFNFFNAWTK